MGTGKDFALWNNALSVEAAGCGCFGIDIGGKASLPDNRYSGY